MGFIYWIVVGLMAGWLAGKVMKGGGYGVVTDIVLGILGGIVGGFVFGLLDSTRVDQSVRSSSPLLAR